VRAALRRVHVEPEPRKETAGQTVDRVVLGWQAGMGSHPRT
jgi:hypothetical protein